MKFTQIIFVVVLLVLFGVMPIVKANSEIVWQVSNWAESQVQEASSYMLIPETLKNKDFRKIISREEMAAVCVNMYESITGKKAEKIQIILLQILKMKMF